MYEIALFTRDDKLSSNCYVLLSDNEYCVIDPSVDIKTVMDYLHTQNLPKYVLLTHEHIDHAWEIESYVCSGVTVLCSEECGKNIKDPRINCSIWVIGREASIEFPYQILNDNDEITVGQETLTVYVTKGHSEGGLTFVGSDYCFTGDTLFAGGTFGRYDLPGSSFVMIRDSLNRILDLNDFIIVYSGHGESCRLSDTKSLLRNRRT